MKIVAVNGSPRKEWNTAELLRKTLEGAASRGMETRLVHLYDLDFKGCLSCFACKLRSGLSYGRCAVRDGLTSVLDEIRSAHALVIGSPVYFFDASGETRSFLERLLFPSLVYTNPPSSIFPHRLNVGLIYTMNLTMETAETMGLDKIFSFSEAMLERAFGYCETLVSADTLQFKDYSKYETAYFNAEEKQRRHREEFPLDLEKAYELGRRLAVAIT